MRNAKLRNLYRRVDQCKFCKTEGNKLQHIHGFGAINPRLMFILVNPTYRNLSSDPEYVGSRFPFIGVRHFWRVLAAGGLFDREVAYRLPIRAEWERRHTGEIQKELKRRKLFLTNLVKCCYSHSNYPDASVIRSQIGLSAEEINIVKPKKIIAFGGLVYKKLTGNTIKLFDCWSGLQKNTVETLSGLGIPVVPCYFPIGRGNPRKAAEMLRKLRIAVNIP